MSAPPNRIPGVILGLMVLFFIAVCSGAKVVTAFSLVGGLVALAVGGGVVFGITARKKDEAQRRGNDAKLSAVLTRLADGSGGAEDEAELLDAIAGMPFSAEGSRLATEAAVNILHRHIEHGECQRSFLKFLRSTVVSSPAREFAYRQSLLLLTMHRSAPVKHFVLCVARWYYGSTRPDGVLTVYDEQAIQNDLLTYQSAAPPEADPVSLRDVLTADAERRNEEAHRKAEAEITSPGTATVMVAGAFVVAFAGYLAVSRVTSAPEPSPAPPAQYTPTTPGLSSSGRPSGTQELTDEERELRELPSLQGFSDKEKDEIIKEAKNFDRAVRNLERQRGR